MKPSMSLTPVALARRALYGGLPIRALLTAFLLLPLVPVLAQFTSPRHTVAGGGGTSTGGVFQVSGTLGQPDAGGPLTGGRFSLTGGFWTLPKAIQTPGAPTLIIVPAGPGFATISWSPNTGTNWILQERLSLTTGTWINSPSGWANPITVPATLPAKFYRLSQP